MLIVVRQRSIIPTSLYSMPSWLILMDLKSAFLVSTQVRQACDEVIMTGIGIIRNQFNSSDYILDTSTQASCPLTQCRPPFLVIIVVRLEKKRSIIPCADGPF